RGTPLDPFGWATHRRMERQLIADYEQTIEKLLPRLNADNYDVAVEIASLPEQIRGYDVVKEHYMHLAEQKKKQLMKDFEEPPAGRSVVQIQEVAEHA